MRRTQLVLSWLLLAACGFAAGWSARVVTASADAAAPAATIRLVAGGAPSSREVTRKSETVSATAPAARTATTTVADSGFVAPRHPREFLERVDEIAERGRNGDLTAAMTMWEHLSQCAGASKSGDAGRIQAQYEEDLERLQRHDWPQDVLDQQQEQLDTNRSRALQRIEMCESLGDRSVDALGWLEFAIFHDDPRAHRAVLSSLAFAMDRDLQVRHAERIARLHAATLDHIERHIAAGDARALGEMARAYGQGLLEFDELSAFVYQYANWLAPRAQGQYVPDPELLARGLTPEQRAEGKRRGRELYESCCTGG